MQDKRALTVHFSDGSKLALDFPRQAGNEYAAAIKVDELLKKRHLLVEADGAMLVIPFENVKYLQVYPAPNLPGMDYIKGASIVG